MKKLLSMVLCAVLLMLMSGCSKEGKTGVFDNAAQNTAAGNNDGSASENTVQPVKNIAVRRVSLDKYISEYNSELRSSVTTSINTKVSDSDYIGCAKTLINKALKNPSTAVYNSEQVYEKDDYGRAIVLLDVSAQNSFGGWVRSSYYVCIQSVESDGTFYYNSALPYIEDDTSYQFDYFKVINSFDEDPADKELKDLIIDPDKVVQEGTFSISPEQELKCYKISLSSLTQIIYVDTTTEEIVSLKFITNNSLSSDKSDEAKILSTAAAVLANTGKNTTKENISNVLNLNSISEADMSEYYADEVVYDRGYSEYGIIFAVTLVDENSYSSGLYWTPNNGEKYFEALGDRFFEIGDYDNAIDFYNQGEVGGDKIPAAYYNKAEQCLQNNDFENAGLYFDFAGNYKDASVRAFEVYYKAGEKYLSDMDYSAAAQYFDLAGDYSDAKEKYKECCFKQGELYANDKQYLDAITCFANAGDYSNAESRYKESSYEYAEQQLLLGNIGDAEKYFKQAGDHKDASIRMESYYYDQGCEYLNSKQYLKAIDSFAHDLSYSDAKEKYKEANYHYGEELLNSGNTASAADYFYNAGDYKDASTRVQRYYYENAEKHLNNKNYLTAADEYSRAGTYSDSGTKILECYYRYGVQQMNLNYISDAITYLSKCRGYKDTDEILLSYYYSDASKAVNKLLNTFPQNSFEKDVDDAYASARAKLVLCEGYKDSKNLLKIVDKLYYVWDEMPSATNWRASLGGMTASYSGNTLYISKEKFISGGGCKLSLSHNVSDNTFEADITDLFNDSARESDVKRVISGLLVLFTGIEDTSDFDASFADKSNWNISGKTESFSMKYGGYNISVKTKSVKDHYIDCHISVSK